MKKPALFLDRDGVINRRIVGSYIRTWSEFEFLEGVLEALPILQKYFSPIVVVTNQQGIAKEIMTEADLQILHQQMLEAIQAKGGYIDKVYYCKEHHTKNALCRKPNIGMGLAAQKDFPNIDFSTATMVGDSVSDILFGKRLEMQTILITTKEDIDKVKLQTIKSEISYTTSSLLGFAKWIDDCC